MPEPPRSAAAQRPLTVRDWCGAGKLRRLGARIELLPEIDSTNRHLRANAHDLPDGAVAATEYQSAGRGRLGRRWSAPRGSSLLVSFLLHESAESVIPGAASLLGAVSALEAVKSIAPDVDAALRWPNDLTVGGKKLGGVLAESWTAGPGRRSVVIGIGLNVYQQPGHFAGPLADKATSLEIESTVAVDRAALASVLVRRLDDWLERIAMSGHVEDLRRRWVSYCKEIGREITVQTDGRTYSGRLERIHDNGDLALELPTGERRRFGAETTTRQW